jgi:hypothetical protein
MLLVASGLVVLLPAKDENVKSESGSNLDYLLPDDVLAYFSIPSVPYFIREIRQTAFMRLAFDAEIQAAFKEGIRLLKDKMAEITPKYDEKVGINLLDLPKLFSGEFSFALIDLPVNGSIIPDMAAAVTLGDNAPKVEELLPKWLDLLIGDEEEISLKKEEKDGVTFYRISGEELLFAVLAIIDGTLYAASTEARMQDIIARLKGEITERPLSASRKYRSVRRNVSGEKETMIIYLDLPEISAGISRNNPEIDDLFKTARLDLYDVAGFGTTSSNGSSVDRFYIRFKPDKLEDPYLKKILASARKAVEMDFAAMSPRSAFFYVSTSTSAQFIFDSFLEGLEEGAVDATDIIEAFEKELGIKLREEILPLLDGELSAMAALAPMEMLPDFAIAWDSKTPEKLESVIGKVLDLMQENGYGKHETNEYSGVNIHSFVPEGAIAIFSPAFAIVDGKLIAAGSSQSLMRILSTKKENSLASHPDFKNAAGNTLDNSFDFVYIDPRPLIAYGYNFVPSLVQSFNKNPDMPFRIKSAALPTTERLLSFFEPMCWSGSNDGRAARAEFRSNIGGIPAITTGLAGVVVVAAYVWFKTFEPPLETALPSLRTIEQAQRLFYLRHRRYATWEEIVEEGYLNPSLASGVHGKFKYTILHADKEGWSARAVPLQPDRVGRWNYYIDKTGILRRAKLPDMADGDSEPVEQ